MYQIIIECHYDEYGSVGIEGITIFSLWYNMYLVILEIVFLDSVKQKVVIFYQVSTAVTVG